jgi:hypothetical protein
MKTIAQQLNIKEFPFKIKDNDGNQIYFENLYKYWIRREYDSNGNVTYWENSNGDFEDNRPKPCDGKVVEIDGKKYELKEVTFNTEEK